MSVAELWAVAGCALCAAEMLAPGVFLLWIGLAALGAGGLTALLGLGWQSQVASFIALALILIFWAARRFGRRPQRDWVNAPGAGLIGATCTALEFRAGEGRVQFRDATWAARVASGLSPVPGAVLRVTGLEGTVLIVEPVPG